MKVLAALVVLGGCGFEIRGAGGSIDDAASRDAPLHDVLVAPDAFPTGAIGTPQRVDELSLLTSRDDDITLTGDMLEIFFESDRGFGGDGDIYTSRRASVTDPWDTPVVINELSTIFSETSMEVSPDGLTLYFSSDRPTSDGVDVWVTTRADRSSAWAEPTRVMELNTSDNEYNAQPWSDTVLLLGSDRGSAGGGSDVFIATRASASEPWGTPSRITGLDTALYEGEAFMDGSGAIWLTGPTINVNDLYRAIPNGDGTYSSPQVVSELSTTTAAENDAWLSPDGHTLYFTSTATGSLDIYVATR